MTAAVVIAPHPDDEVLGAASVLASRDSVVVHISDGVPPWTPPDERDRLRSTRQHESRKAWESLPARVVGTAGLGLADMTVWRSIPAVADWLCQLLAGRGPTDIYVPAYQGGHPDHDAIYVAAQLARHRLCRRSGLTWQAYGLYGLVTAGQLRFGWLAPEHYPNGTVAGHHRNDLEAKRAALSWFQSQIRPGSVVRRWLDHPEAEGFAPLPDPAVPLPQVPRYYDEVLDFRTWGAEAPEVERMLHAALRTIVP